MTRRAVLHTRGDELVEQAGRLLNLSFVQRRLGDEPAALDALDRAVTTALAYLGSFTGEWLLDARSSQVVKIFDEFAWAQARVGAPDRALAGIEAIRSSTLRGYTMSDRERNLRALAMMAPITPRLAARAVDGETRVFLDREPPPVPDSLELPPIRPLLDPLLHELQEIPTALVSLVAPEARELTALICWPDGTIDSEQWSPGYEGSLPRPDYDAPGPFRERRLQAISRSSYEDLFGPVDRRLRASGIERVVLSVPGWLGRFPYEALFDGETFVGDHYRIVYVPSLRVGADLVRRDARGGPPRVLVIGYAGDDLRWSTVEQDGVCTHMRGHVTALSPVAYTKMAIVEELTGDYDVIHFCCHASYDDANPLGAALHLVPDPLNDRQRITAYELMSGVQLEHAPVVTLSACASGVMDLSGTNSAYGLVGGLLRAGARCVIGTRWAVYDETAATTMVEMYKRQASTGETIPNCLYAVTSELRRASRIEDWAAFGCIGVP